MSLLSTLIMVLFIFCRSHNFLDMLCLGRALVRLVGLEGFSTQSSRLNVETSFCRIHLTLLGAKLSFHNSRVKS